ncbi:MAG TPA: hypothetical protein VMU16_07305 [Candidatus Binataceae bacterium]|nr:hypothetical protein [Candidatus Binataceae bacterium]
MNAISPPREPISLLRYCPGLIVLAIAIADITRFADPDLWGHVRFGQEILKSGGVVRYDPYSYSAPHHLWLNHEWLAEAIMASFYNWLGVFGLESLKLVCVAVTIVFIAAAEAETGAPVLIQGGVLIASALMLTLEMQYRPQMFSFALLSVLLYLLARDNFRRPVRLWLAVPILALWANLHGGFIVGVGALWIYSTISGARDISSGRGTARALRLGAISIAATAATLATPYGSGTWTAVAHALSNPYTPMFVRDWYPLLTTIQFNLRQNWLVVLYCAGAIMLVIALSLSFVLAPSRDDLPMIAIATMMSAAAFIAVRNISIAVIAIAAPLANHLSLAASRWRGAIRRSPPPIATARHPLSAISTVLAIILFWHSGLFASSILAPDPYPIGACEFIQGQHLKGNILAKFSWGEYIIWRLAPESKIFIDGRYDTVYPPGVVADYANFIFNLSGGNAPLTNYPTDFVLVSPYSPARKLMDSRSDWQLIYSDPASRLYARANSSAAHLAGVPVNGAAYETSFP